MSLKHALLGFLNYGPMTGYELKKFFDTSVAHFWNAELSQIYPTLKAMESEGLVEMQVDVQEDRPNRKVYSVTEVGRRALVEWLGEPPEPEQVREPMMIKVFFGAALPKDRLLELLHSRSEEMRRQVEYHKNGFQFISAFAQQIGLEREAFFWGLTVDCGIKQYSAAVEWAEETIRKVEAMDDSEFPIHRPDEHEMDSRKAFEILDRITAALPRAALASARQKGDGS